MHKNYLALLFILSVGCSAPKFYVNGPLDARSLHRDVSVFQIKNENSFFSVYKIDSQYYGLRYTKGDSKRDTFIGQLNNTIIFDDAQIADLKMICKKIIENYNQNPVDTVEIIEYHLALKESEALTQLQALSYSNQLSTDIKYQEFTRVAFRLQFVNSPKTLLGSGKEIIFMFGNQVGKMKIKDLKALLNDLNK